MWERAYLGRSLGLGFGLWMFGGWSGGLESKRWVGWGYLCIGIDLDHWIFACEGDNERVTSYQGHCLESLSFGAYATSCEGSTRTRKHKGSPELLSAIVVAC